MKLITYKCDFCGKSFETKLKEIDISLKYNDNIMSLPDYIETKKDICPDCTTKFLKAVDIAFKEVELKIPLSS